MDEEKYKLKKLVDKLEKIKGRHTELVSVYIPAGYNLDGIRSQLGSEAGTAVNIKSKTVRTNVVTAIEKMLSELRLYRQTPENGFVLFSGNVSEVDGKPDYQVWTIIPPEPINVKLYRCDSYFILEPLKAMLEAKYVYGLIVIDHKDASIALLKGKSIVNLGDMESQVMGKFRKGGQCLLKDTFVQMIHGNILSIDKVKEGEHILSADLNHFDTVNDTCMSAWRTTKNELITINTKNPKRIIRCSPEHTFFVINDEQITEKTAEALKTDDLLLTPEKLNFDGKLQILKSWETEKVNLTNAGRQVIKLQRLKNKMSQDQLAQLINSNVNQANISALERSKLTFKRSNLKLLCRALDINFEGFVSKHISSIILPKVLNIKLAQMMGYFIGDGSFDKNRICLFDADNALVLSYSNLITSIFKTTPVIKHRKSKGYYELKLYSRDVKNYININFGKEKEVPKIIAESKLEVVAGFLRGLFDAEGYVSNRIGLGVNNITLAKQLLYLLPRFGIVASIGEYDNRKNPYSKNTRYTIEINDSTSLKRFYEKIGFSSAKKKEKLNILMSKKSDRNKTIKVLPFGKKIYCIAKKYGYNTKSFKTSTNFFRNERLMSKNVFGKVFSKKDDLLEKELKKIKNFNLVPARISKIKRDKGIFEMIDLSMYRGNFIADGIVVHNSAPRFQRVREEQIKYFFNKVAAHAKDAFMELKNLQGILIGGPGPAKEDFFNSDYLLDQLKKKVIALKDISDTGDQGLRQLVHKSEDILSKEEIIQEKKILDVFFMHLAKDDGLASYGEAEVMANLKNSTIEKLLVSETLPEEKITEFSEIAKQFGTELVLISEECQEGVQLKELGGFGAILRYKTN